MAGRTDVCSASIVKGTLPSRHFWHILSNLRCPSWRSCSSSNVNGSGFLRVWYVGLISEKMGRVSSFHGRLKEESLYRHLNKSLTRSSSFVRQIADSFTIIKLTCWKGKKTVNYSYQTSQESDKESNENHKSN